MATTMVGLQGIVTDNSTPFLSYIAEIVMIVVVVYLA